MLDKANTARNAVSDARLCELVDWLGRLQYMCVTDPRLGNDQKAAAGFGDVRECLWELMGDRAALAYMAEFERLAKLRPDA